MATLADAAAPVVDRLVGRLFRAQERFGDEFLSELRDAVSVPIEYATGPRGGRVVIRSLPGESPRQEFGNYVASLFSETSNDGDGRIITRISSTMARSRWLELGTDRMAERPHFRPTLRTMKPLLKQRFKDSKSSAT